MLRILIVSFLILTVQVADVRSDIDSMQDIGSKGRQYTDLFYTSELDKFISHIVNKEFTIHELTAFRKKVDSEFVSWYITVYISGGTSANDRFPDKDILLWFQDEARIGQQGTIYRVWADTGN